MRIDFDAGSARELAAVSALIDSLNGRVRGELVTTVSGAEPALTPLPAIAESDAAAPIEAVAESLPPPAPPAAVAPPLPPAPAAPAATAPAGVELDADGLPYDARIHAKPASKKKDGCWRGKRGLDDATREAVTAELRAALAAPAPAAAPAPMFEESAPGVPAPLPPSDSVDAATAFGAGAAGDASSAPPPPPPPAAAPAPVAPPPPAPAPVAPPPAAPAPAAPAPVPAAPAVEGPATDFASLMKKITARQSAGILTVQGTTEIAVSLGLTGVRDLMVRPDLIASVDALLPPLA